jgi:hypothetical protein
MPNPNDPPPNPSPFLDLEDKQKWLEAYLHRVRQLARNGKLDAETKPSSSSQPSPSPSIPRATPSGS